MTGASDTRLAAVLDVLLPGGEGFPPASDVGLADWIMEQPRFAGAVDWLLAALPDDDSADLTAALRALEDSQPEPFGALIVAAYSGYYTHRDVLAVIEAKAGYKARPPQPGGYALEAFDPEMLAVPRSRPPSYRDPKKEHAS